MHVFLQLRLELLSPHEHFCLHYQYWPKQHPTFHLAQTLDFSYPVALSKHQPSSLLSELSIFLLFISSVHSAMSID